MTDDTTVTFSDKPHEQAVLLLAAAEELGYGPAAVSTTAGAFVVPQDVADKAFAHEKKQEPVKKATAKKATKKKVE